MGEYHPSVHIQFVNLGEDKRLPSKYEVALFRLIQESLNNALKHADAKEIKVKLEVCKEQVSVIIRDNGKGFDPAVNKNGSFGLIGMKERIAILDGELKIESTPNEGTMIHIKVPVLE